MRDREDSQLNYDDMELISSEFDSEYYETVYSDKLTQGTSAIRDFVSEGWRFFRKPTPWFDTEYYLGANPDVRASGQNPFLHYLQHGRSEGRLPAKPPAVAPSASNASASPPLTGHELQAARSDFDYGYYAESYPEVAGCDPVLHYLEVGWREGKNPAPWFDTRHYLRFNPDIAKAGLNPFVHYVLYGRDEGRSALRGHGGLNIVRPLTSETPLVALPVLTGRASGSATTSATVAVHLHVYYLEVVDEILAHLAAMPRNFHLFVTADSEPKLAYVRAKFGRMRPEQTIDCILVENRGRDIAPMVVTLGPKLLAFDIVLHVHTKVTMEAPARGERWRRRQLSYLLHDEEYIASIIELFTKDQRCGLVWAEPSDEIKPFMHWGRNAAPAKQLLDALAIESRSTEGACPAFPAGFMFWFRPASLAPLLDHSLNLLDFPPEPIGDDGSLPHAIERCVTVIAGSRGFTNNVAVKPLRADLCTPRAAEVSVVVPIHNAAGTIHDAVQSLVERPSPSIPIQIILVDNASTDDSRALIDFYASRYHFITAIAEPKLGAGSARNAGLAHARAPWVTFLDADDLLTLGALERLVAAGTAAGADLVVSPLQIFDGSKASPPIPAAYTLTTDPINVAALAEEQQPWILTPNQRLLLRILFSDFGPCAKLYRTSMLESNALRFSATGNYEDNIFVYRAYLAAQRLVCEPGVSYIYRKIVGELTQSRRRSEKDALSFLDAMSQLLDLTETVSCASMRRLMDEALGERQAEHRVEFDSVVRDSARVARLFDSLDARIERIGGVA